MGTLTDAVAAAQRASGDDKLAMFRQQSSLVARKLAQREEALEALRRDEEAAARDIEAREARLSELSGPKYMRRDEFRAYAASLRAKTAQFKQFKAALAEARQEHVVLARTEALLVARAGAADAGLRALEEKKGVAGYTRVASDLEDVSALKARADESKGKTLAEIAVRARGRQGAASEAKRAHGSRRGAFQRWTQHSQRGIFPHRSVSRRVQVSVCAS